MFDDMSIPPKLKFWFSPLKFTVAYKTVTGRGLYQQYSTFGTKKISGSENHRRVVAPEERLHALCGNSSARAPGEPRSRSTMSLCGRPSESLRCRCARRPAAGMKDIGILRLDLIRFAV